MLDGFHLYYNLFTSFKQAVGTFYAFDWVLIISTHTLQGNINGTLTIVWSPQYQSTKTIDCGHLTHTNILHLSITNGYCLHKSTIQNIQHALYLFSHHYGSNKTGHHLQTASQKYFPGRNVLYVV